MPTILEILNIALDQTMQGRSLLNMIHGNDNHNRPAFFETDYHSGEERMGHWRGLRTEDNWKFIYDVEKNAAQLYNIGSDPHELHDVIQGEQEKARQLHKRLFDQLKKNAQLFPTTTEQVEMTPEHLERLKSLGYIQ
jgi:arylsulfatase A-like enzyme